MNQYILKIPNRLVLASHVYNLGVDRLNLSKPIQCVFDFTSCTYGEPFAMLLLAVQLRQLVRQNPDKQFMLRTNENSFIGYAKHVGYFRFIGFNLGNPVNSGAGTGNYAPVSTFQIPDVAKAARLGLKHQVQRLI